MAKPIRLPNAQEQAVLDQLVVRPITPEERPRWKEQVSTHHYLKNATLVGEHLCYVAEYQGTWLALLGWAAPARQVSPSMMEASISQWPSRVNEEPRPALKRGQSSSEAIADSTESRLGPPAARTAWPARSAATRAA